MGESDKRAVLEAIRKRFYDDLHHRLKSPSAAASRSWCLNLGGHRNPVQRAFSNLLRFLLNAVGFFESDNISIKIKRR
jgi:hypothetical protein